MRAEAPPTNILFVFGWLVVGGEETEVRLLASNLDPSRYKIDVIACFRKETMPEQTHTQLIQLGVDVDTAPYDMAFEQTIQYLADKLARYDVVVSCQNVADIYPALERLHLRPPLIEHGGLVTEATAGPKHFTSRYVGVCRSIRDAAASVMPGREECAVEIPSMVDLNEFVPCRRTAIRASLGVADHEVLIGWVGRLDSKKNVEIFIKAASILIAEGHAARFVVVGGPDAFMPQYADGLKALSSELGLDRILKFLGDRADVPDLLIGLDIFVWLSRGEGMPHVIAEAGAAALPVIATADNGVTQQIEEGVSGLFVPYDDPQAAADKMRLLIESPDLRLVLGAGLRRKVEQLFSVDVVVPQWEKLFDAVVAERRGCRPAGVFRSFFQGGFECSTHRLPGRDGELTGRRLDLISSTVHDVRVAEDYLQLRNHKLLTVRDGLRWHLIERSPGNFDWRSALPMVQAARRMGTQVIWDLLHYGWPDDIDIWSPRFVDRFARFAGRAAQIVRDECDDTPFFSPINEISFFAWAGGDAGYLNPFGRGKGFELKVQLTRASIAAMDAIVDVDSRSRFVHCDPVINVVAAPLRPWDRATAEGHRLSQYQAWDMLSGRMWPQLGGGNRYLDIIGVNYYPNNQWIHGGSAIEMSDTLYRPFRKILAEVYARYGKPLVVSETGAEEERRAPWLSYIGGEVRAALQRGVQVEGVCLYPVVNHLGWDDDRLCENGLLSHVAQGRRVVYEPLATELRRQNKLLSRLAYH